MAEERELKLALESVADLERLLAELPEPTAVVEQRNHYFVDPEGKTGRDRTMVRLREKQKRGAADASVEQPVSRGRGARGGAGARGGRGAPRARQR